MSVSGNRMIELLKQMDYIRLSTTEGELKGAVAIKNALQEFGVEGKFESFKAPWYEIKKVRFEVVEPYTAEYTVTGYGFSGSTPPEGITADFLYVENGEEMDLQHAKGKIVLLSSRIGFDVYDRLNKAGVAGFIDTSGNFNDELDKTDLDKRMLRDKHLEYGKIPGVCIRIADALELLRNHPTKVRITIEQEEGEADSHNVIAEIPGTEYPEEVIVYTAHYDSVEFSHGIFDNATGSVIIAEICRYFAENKPKRTLRFIWCGSEERGLLGSKAYIKDHDDQLAGIKLAVNIDMAGPIIGRDTAIVTANENLCHMVEYLYKEIGHSMTVRQDIYSSDSIPFADKGIPAINFTRFGGPGAAACHNRTDILDTMSGEYLERTANFVVRFSERIVNACFFPVPREIPANIVEKVDKYLRKDKEKKDEKK